VYRRCILLLSLAACQAKDAPPPVPRAIEARDGSGALVASLVPGRPCKVSIGLGGALAMDVTGPPLAAEVAGVHWTGDHRDNGTTLARAGAMVARVYGHDSTLSLFDPAGVPIVRLDERGGAVEVSDAGRRLLRHVTRKADAFTVDSPALTVTGTGDAELVALLVSPELQPELRMLAACERVL